LKGSIAAYATTRLPSRKLIVSAVIPSRPRGEENYEYQGKVETLDPGRMYKHVYHHIGSLW
jgi:hypothetical protein